MDSGETKPQPGQTSPRPPAGQTRPPAPDTPELAERRAQAPAAQALIKATRRLFAEGGPEWATDKRIHETATRPGGRKGFPLGTIRYYFGGREQLLVHVARYEHLSQLDRIRRALRTVKTSDALARTLLRHAEDTDHYEVEFGLLTEARQMPKLRATQAALWQDRLDKLTEMVTEPPTTRARRGRPRPVRDRAALELDHRRARRPSPRQPRDQAQICSGARRALRGGTSLAPRAGRRRSAW